MAIKFKNPSNGFVEESSSPWLWCLLFGTFYFMFKGVWTHAVLSFIVAVFTGGLSWLIYPFFAKQILITHYNKMGWEGVIV